MFNKTESNEPNLSHLAKKELIQITQLAQSQLISEKLQSFNILLFTFIIAILTTHFLLGPTLDSLSVGLFLIFYVHLCTNNKHRL